MIGLDICPIYGTLNYRVGPMKSRALQVQMPEVFFECSFSFLVCAPFSLRNTLTLQVIP